MGVRLYGVFDYNTTDVAQSAGDEVADAIASVCT